jgi:hypothetical protein
MDRSSIEYILSVATKLPNSLKTVLDETQKLYDEEKDTPIRGVTETRKRRRKTDIRTIRRRGRESWANTEKADPRRIEQGTLKAQFYKLRREVKRRREKRVRANSTASWEWNLSLAEWLMMWMSCPPVEVGVNVRVPAWTIRGRSPKHDVQLKRIDVNKPFCLDNLMIIKGKTILYSTCE